MRSHTRKPVSDVADNVLLNVFARRKKQLNRLCQLPLDRSEEDELMKILLEKSELVSGGRWNDEMEEDRDEINSLLPADFVAIYYFSRRRFHDALNILWPKRFELSPRFLRILEEIHRILSPKQQEGVTDLVLHEDNNNRQLSGFNRKTSSVESPPTKEQVSLLFPSSNYEERSSEFLGAPNFDYSFSFPVTNLAIPPNQQLMLNESQTQQNWMVRDPLPGSPPRLPSSAVKPILRAQNTPVSQKKNVRFPGGGFTTEPATEPFEF
eukprot:TRINITY_DN2480_c0_g1_i1.p1 TRINITY_DN2480_c0_g1~~TRINITY_DN2480_c0_g1_i1.p1  ORF type:complete len:266 (-),score=59.60 TRINITY_DN2480_c0_g1_i1:103-900(-)